MPGTHAARLAGVRRAAPANPRTQHRWPARRPLRPPHCCPSPLPTPAPISLLPLPPAPLPPQVCMMVGVKPVPDALGRVNKLEVGGRAGAAAARCRALPGAGGLRRPGCRPAGLPAAPARCRCTSARCAPTPLTHATPLLHTRPPAHPPPPARPPPGDPPGGAGPPPRGRGGQLLRRLPRPVRQPGGCRGRRLAAGAAGVGAPTRASRAAPRLRLASPPLRAAGPVAPLPRSPSCPPSLHLTDLPPSPR